MEKTTVLFKTGIYSPKPVFLSCYYNHKQNVINKSFFLCLFLSQNTYLFQKKELCYRTVVVIMYSVLQSKRKFVLYPRRNNLTVGKDIMKKNLDLEKSVT